MKKITALMTLVTVFAFPCIARAANAVISDFNNADSAVISGHANDGSQVSISIFGKNMTAADAENMTANALVYANQIAPDGEDCSFSVPISFVGYATGEYGVAVFQKGHKLLSDTFYYADNDDSLTAIGGLNDAVKTGNATELNNFISNNKIQLEFKSRFDSSVSVSEISGILSKSAPFDTNNKADCAASYKKAMIIGAVTSGVITDIRTVDNELDTLQNGTVKEVYGSAYVTDDAKLSAAAKLKIFAPFADFAAFDLKLSEALALSVVRYPTGAGDVKTVIQALDPTFPENLLTSSICRDVAYKDYASLEVLKTAMESVAAQQGSGNGTTGDSGSSGGGSSSGGGGTPFTASSGKTDANLPITQGGTFSDLDAVPWAREAIEYLAKKEIISGNGNGLFCPNDTIKREEFVKMLVVMFSLDTENSSEKYFTDIPDDAWYKPYVNAAYVGGIVSGRPDGSFGSGENISRQDAAVMLYKCIGKDEPLEKTPSTFTDAEEISDYAVNIVEKIKSMGIISGYEDGGFKPHSNMTRAEAACILYKTDKGVQ